MQANRHGRRNGPEDEWSRKRRPRRRLGGYGATRMAFGLPPRLPAHRNWDQWTDGLTPFELSILPVILN